MDSRHACVRRNYKDRCELEFVKTERDNAVRCNRWHLISAPYRDETICNSEIPIVPDDMITEHQTTTSKEDHVVPRAGDCCT